TSGACEPPTEAAKLRGCVGVAHKQTSELAFVVALDELNAFCARNDTQSVEPTVISLPRYGPDAATHDRFEQSHALEIGQVDRAPILNLARCADAMRSP